MTRAATEGYGELWRAMMLAQYSLNDQERELHRWIVATAPHPKGAMDFCLALKRRMVINLACWAFCVLNSVYQVVAPYHSPILRWLGISVGAAAMFMVTAAMDGILRCRKSIYSQTVDAITRCECTPLEFIRQMDRIAMQDEGQPTPE